MKPILFANNETDFTTNGIGRLDCISCKVIEERNGMYELEAEIPITGLHASEIEKLSIIGVVPHEGGNVQAFVVYKITKPINGRFMVYARHISYRLSDIPCTPFSIESSPQACAQALAGLKSHAVETCPFNFTTDVTTGNPYIQKTPASIRQRLGGVEGSILDQFGGEYEWDNFNVRLLKQRGRLANTTGITLRYGKNITDINQEEEIANTATGVVPFWIDTDGNNLVMLPEVVVYSENADNYPYHLTQILDLSSEFQDKPTQAQLRSVAQIYVTKDGFGEPKVSIKVSFVDLWKSEEYKDIAPLEQVQLCDEITVDFNKLGIKALAKVVKTDYDVLRERYNSIEVGSIRTTLAQAVTDRDKDIDTAFVNELTRVNTAISNATAWLTSANGYVVAVKNNDGSWKELFLMNTNDPQTATQGIRFNNNGLGFFNKTLHPDGNILSGPYDMAWTIDGRLGDFANKNYWNFINGEFSLSATATVGGKTVDAIAQEKADAAETAAENTAAAALAAQVAIYNGKIADLQDQIDGNVTTWYYSGVPTLNNPPANQWTTTTDKDNHIGDIYYDSDTGYAYRFMKDGNNYVWTKISDSDIEAALAEAQDAWDLADNKRRVFITQPVSPYDVGDLWVQGSNGDIKRCAIAKTDTQTYNASDWVLASKYTDDSALTSWISGTYTTDKTNLQSQIDSKAETWYQSADPSSAWTTEALKTQHIGDLWYKTTDDTTWYYTKDGSTYKWVQQNVPTDVFDKIDGKAHIYTSQPTTPYHVGDLWFASTSSEIKVCITERLSGNYTASDWAKRDKYTDDSAFTSFRDGTYASFVTATNTGIENAQNTANSKIVTYYQASAPSTHSTGDLWIDTDDGNKLYRWNGSSWANIQDSGIQSALTAASNAQTTADGKIVTFAQTSAPTATDVGDLWIDTDDNNKMYRWNGSSWVALSDSSSLVAWVSATYTTDKTNLQNQIDGKAETWYQSSDPSTNWSASDKAKHTGDLWYKTSDNTTWYYNGTQWVQQNVPTAVFDKIDGKAQIFTSQPTTPYNIGDLWFNSTSSEIKVCTTARSTGNYTASDWEKRDKYVDATDISDAIDDYDDTIDQEEVWKRLTGNSSDCIILQNGVLGIKATAIITGILADRNGQFSLNMDTGALTMNSGMFKGEINVNNNFLVNSSGGMTAKSGSFGALKIDSSNSSVYAEGVITLMDDDITLDTSGADRNYNYDLIIDTAYFSTGTYIGYKYSTFSGVNSDELGTVSLYRYYDDGSISSRIEYITVYALSTFQYQFNEYMYSNSGMYLLRFNLKYHGVYRTLKFTIKTSSTMKSLLFSGADGIVAPSIKGTLRGKVQASDFSCGGWRFEGRNKKTLFFGEDGSTENYVRLDVFYGLTMNYSVQNYRMNVGLTSITRVDNGVTWYAQFYQGSDERIKENIKPIDTELSVNLIDKTEPKSFSFIHDTGTHYGMIAQEARAVLDELGEKDARLEHELNISEMPVENMRTIEYVEYIPHLINYVKDLRETVNRQQAEIDELKEIVKRLSV